MTSRLFSQRSSLPTLSAPVAAVRPLSRSPLLFRSLACTGRCFSTEAAASDAASAAATPSSSAASSSSSPDDVKLLAEQAAQLKKQEAELKELNEKYVRALAEGQNTLNRSITQLADAKKFAVQSFAKQLLEVADVLEIAIKAAEPHATATTDPNFKNLFEGMSMTQKVLLQIFQRNGLQKFEPHGEKFDPFFHDGLLQVEDPSKTPGTVGLVLKSGYKLHERCLRAAQVGTVKAPAKQ